MLVWGGRTPSNTFLKDGGRYDAEADRWTPIATTSAPMGRYDDDGVPDASDCAPYDTSASVVPPEVEGLIATEQTSTRIEWEDVGSAFSDVAGGLLSDLTAGGWPADAACLADDVATSFWVDSRPTPEIGNGYYYLVRAQNVCGAGTYGPGRNALDSASPCP